MAKQYKPVLVFAFSALSLIACAKEKSPKLREVAPPVGSDNALHSTLPGSLSESQRANIKSADAEACDRKFVAEITEITASLDSKSAALDAFERESAPTFTEVSAGDIKFHQIELASGAVEPGWKEGSLSWDDAKALYAEVKPNDKPGAGWLALRLKVRALLGADRRRLVFHHNLMLGKDSEKVLKKAADATQGCADKPGCSVPDFDQETLDFVAGNSIYSRIYDSIHRAQTGNGRHAYTVLLSQRLRYDLSLHYEFQPNASIFLTGAKELTLPLVPANEKVSEEILPLLTQAWKTADLDVRAVFAKAHPQIFKLELAPQPSSDPAASYVDFARKVVHLIPEMNTRRLAHEIGHVLGFKDRHFEVWDPKSCRYLVQTRADDVMSSPETGSVLAEDFATLAKVYDKKKL